MLENITWGQFFLAVVVGALIWAFFLVRLFLESKPKIPQAGKPPPRRWIPADEPESPAATGDEYLEDPLLEEEMEEDPGDQQLEPLAGNASETITAAEPPNSFVRLEKLADEISRLVAVAGNGHDKTVLFGHLREAISGYPDLNLPAFRSAISNLIARAIEKECGYSISRGEADQLWSGLSGPEPAAAIQ